MDFPKVTPNKIKGNSGQSYFASFVNNNLNCIYHTIHEENDYGIDGYIELVIDEKATSKLIGVQIKHGNSYFSNTTDYGYKYHIEEKHLNYYLNNSNPIFIIIMDEDFKRCNWVEVDISRILPIIEDSYYIEIPKSNRIETNFKEAIFNIVTPVIDFRDEIEYSRGINFLLKESGKLMIGIPKNDIMTNSFKTINEYLKRMSINKEKLIKSKTSVDLFFPEYSEETREIYEIPEIMEWLRLSIDIGIPWFYFLDYRQSNCGLSLLVHSYCGFSEDIIKIENKHFINYNKIDLNRFLLRNFDILNKFIEKNNIGEEINSEITKGIIKYFGLG